MITGWVDLNLEEFQPVTVVYYLYGTPQDRRDDTLRAFIQYMPRITCRICGCYDNGETL